MVQKVVTIALVQQNGEILFEKLESGYTLPQSEIISSQTLNEGLIHKLSQALGSNFGVLKLFNVLALVDKSEPQTQLIVIIYEAELNTPITTKKRGSIWREVHKLQQNKVDRLSYLVLERLAEQGTIEISRRAHRDKAENITTIEHNVVIYSDGGSRGNPGPSAAGFVVLNPQGEMIFEGGSYLGVTTNNQAEYHAVKIGLEKAIELGARTVDFRLDSLLVVNQLRGIYQIKNRDLWPIYTHISELSKKFKKITFTHVYRELNKEADALVNKILDEHKT